MVSKRRSNVVKFIGKRETGKTTTINALLGIKGRTVPTLESYEVAYKTIVIHDVVEGKGDFLEKYSMDNPSACYFFFFRDTKDLDKLPEIKGFDMRFVCYGTLGEKDTSRRDIIILDRNPIEIEKYLSFRRP